MTTKIDSVRRIIAVIISFICVGTISFGAGEGNGKLRRSTNPNKGDYIVVFKNEIASADVDTHSAGLTKIHGGEIGFKYRSAIRGFSVRMTAKQAEAMSQDPKVDYIEEDGIATANTVQNSPPWGLD